MPSVCITHKVKLTDENIREHEQEGCIIYESPDVVISDFETESIKEETINEVKEVPRKP